MEQKKEEVSQATHTIILLHEARIRREVGQGQRTFVIIASTITWVLRIRI